MIFVLDEQLRSIEECLVIDKEVDKAMVEKVVTDIRGALELQQFQDDSV